jgi:hypothetical protein
MKNIKSVETRDYFISIITLSLGKYFADQIAFNSLEIRKYIKTREDIDLHEEKY